jgi:hypothetical protein
MPNGELGKMQPGERRLNRKDAENAEVGKYTKKSCFGARISPNLALIGSWVRELKDERVIGSIPLSAYFPDFASLAARGSFSP